MNPAELPKTSGPMRALAEILLVALVALLVTAVGWRMVGEQPLQQQAVLWVANVAVLIAIWAGLRRRRETWAALGLRRPGRDWGALIRLLLQSIAVFVAAIVGFGLGSVLATMLLGEQAGSDMSGYRYLQGNLSMLLVALAAVLIVSSFGEEVIYRGFLMTRIAEMFGNGKAAWNLAVILSSVVFGLVHFGWGLFGIVQTTCMGVALAVAYLLVGRNLWVLVLAHAYLDTLLLVGLYLG
jgi:membrane protease YdiL (CAAX protease family)